MRLSFTSTLLYACGILVGALAVLAGSPCQHAARAGDERACLTRYEFSADRDEGRHSLTSCCSEAATAIAACRPVDCCCCSCPHPPSETGPAAAIGSAAMTKGHASPADRPTGSLPQVLLSDAAAGISGERGSPGSPPSMLPLRI